MFIIRYSEIGLKGDKSRREMEHLLMENIRSETSKNNIDFEYKKTDGRIFILSNDQKFNDILPRIFGIKSFSYADEHTFKNKEEIATIVLQNFKEKVVNKKFAVNVRRKGTHTFNSLEIEKMLGDALYEYSDGVDLKNPDIMVYVEIRDNKLYTFTDKIPGPGGLPLKSEGKLISLFSGGIDSPVSTYMVMKRGSATDLLFCTLAHPYDTVSMLKIAKNLLNKYSVGYNSKIYIIDGSNLISYIIKNPGQKYANLIFKKLLYDYAEKLCREHGYNGIVTGESIGQVSSQTPENLNAMSGDMGYPVFRPLIGFDKEETIDYSKNKGLYFSESIGEFCSLFSKNPGIKVKRHDFMEEIKKFNIDDYFMELISLNKNNIDEYVNSMINRKFSGNEEKNTVFVDLRNGDEYEKWHHYDSINLNIAYLNDFMAKSNKDKRYVFYCKKGLNSAYAASVMVKNGFNAYYITEKELKKKEINA